MLTADIVSLSLLLVIITIALAIMALIIILGIILFHARQRRHPPIQETNDNEDGKRCFALSFHYQRKGLTVFQEVTG